MKLFSKDIQMHPLPMLVGSIKGIIVLAILALAVSQCNHLNATPHVMFY